MGAKRLRGLSPPTNIDRTQLIDVLFAKNLAPPFPEPRPAGPLRLVNRLAERCKVIEPQFCGKVG